MNQDQLRRVFVQMDGSNKGKISSKDMSDTLCHIGIDVNPVEAASIIDLVDKDRDGMLNFREFLHFMYLIENVKKDDLASLAFFAGDSDYSKTIDKHEFINIMATLGYGTSDRRADAVFEQLGDENKQLSYESFQKYLEDCRKK